MKYDKYNTPWRLVANTVFGPPKSGKLYGTMDVDITTTEEYIWSERKAKRKITMTSIAIAAIAKTLAEDTPEINCFIRRGRIIPRDYIDVSTAVLLKGGEAMSTVIIKEADTKTVLEIADELKEKAFEARQGDEDDAMDSKHALAKIPWPFRKWIYLLIRFIVYGIGLRIKSIGISERSFGSITLTNVGSIGLTNSFPALMPMAKLPAVIAIGKIEKRPVVIKDEIVVRTILAGSAAFDHRLVDGIQIARFTKGVIRRIQNPKLME